MRLSAEPFLWNWVLFAWEWKIISISKAENLTLFWPIMTSSHSLGSRTKESRFKGPYVKARDEWPNVYVPN